MTRCSGPHPRDGPWAWLVCFAATTANALHFGFTQSFGVFLPVLDDEFNTNKEKSAWAGSIALALMFMVGPLAVVLSERFTHRVLAIASGLLCIASLASSSFASTLPILYFSYGILFGFGAGCLLNTGYVINSRYFTESKRYLTTGIVASGGSIGVMFMGPTLQVLIDTMGWRNALRVMSGVMFIICMAGATYDPNIEDDSADPNFEDGSVNFVRSIEESVSRLRTLIDCSVWRNVTFVIGTVTIMLTYMGVFVPNIHLVKFANDLDISSTKASHLFIFIGVSSTIARIIIGRILDKRWVTPLQGVQLSSLIMGVSIIALAFAKKYAHLVVFAVFFGIGNGFFVTTQAVFFQTSVDPSKSAIGLGMGYMACSVLILSGAPVVGFIADELGSYIPSFYVIGGVLLFSVLFPFVLVVRDKCSRRSEYATLT